MTERRCDDCIYISPRIDKRIHEVCMTDCANYIAHWRDINLERSEIGNCGPEGRLWEERK